MFSGLALGLVVSEAVGEASTGLEGLVGAVSAGLAVASVAGAGLLASVLVAGLAFVPCGLRTFSTGVAGLAGSIYGSFSLKIRYRLMAKKKSWGNLPSL